MKNSTNDQSISFNQEMVTAILNNRKTQTRRLIKPKKGGDILFIDPNTAQAGESILIDEDTMSITIFSCPYGNIGDRLWVKEPFALVPATAFKNSIDVVQTINPENSEEVAVYAAGWQHAQLITWSRPSEMPYWAHRISLEITNIRTQSLQDITSEDALQEGFLPESTVDEFAAFWGKERWDENPYVWTIDFKLID